MESSLRYKQNECSYTDCENITHIVFDVENDMHINSYTNVTMSPPYDLFINISFKLPICFSKDRH